MPDDVPLGKFSVEVVRIEQKHIECTREYGTPTTPQPGEAEVQFKLDEVDGDKFTRDVAVKVQLRNSEGERLFLALSQYRVGHAVDIEGDVPEESVAETLSELALRVSYPYHRTAISNAVLMAGLPPFLLPLAADSDWITIVKESKSETPL